MIQLIKWQSVASSRLLFAEDHEGEGKVSICMAREWKAAYVGCDLRRLDNTITYTWLMVLEQ